MEYEALRELMRISRIAGLIECLSTMTGAQLSKTTTMILEDAAEQLGEHILDKLKEAAEEVTTDDAKTKIGFAEIQSDGTPPHQ